MKVYLAFYYGIESVDERDFNYYLGIYNSIADAVKELEDAIEVISKAFSYEPCKFEDLEREIFKGEKGAFDLVVPYWSNDCCHIYDVRKAKVGKNVSGRIFYILEQEVKTKSKQNEENQNN